MKCACGTSLWTGLLATVGIIGVGVGGYNAITTGCPLGMCSKDSVSSSITPTSTTGGTDSSGCCSGEAKSDCCGGEAKSGCCSGESTPSDEKTEPKIVAPVDAPEAAKPVASNN
ncbi:MAG: hypothetical protein AB7Q00_05660 [Phycisphaerales bacterium]|nr:MAG: hypothetical protein IPK69_10320 [Phycisphaerales bacterium]